MTGEKKQTARFPNHVRVEPPGGTVEVYTNFVESNWTPYDVRLRFSQVMHPNAELDPDKPIVINQRAAVTMAWAEAKFLRNLLTQLVDGFEKVNGEIKEPKIPT